MTRHKQGELMFGPPSKRVHCATYCNLLEIVICFGLKHHHTSSQMSLLNDWLAACKVEEDALRAELKPFKDGTISRLRVGGVDKMADHIAWIEADIAALAQRMSRLRTME